MKTILHAKHLALGAKMVTFAGWEMPVFYQGIVVEHQTVRSHVGLFDVSHMGRIKVTGPDAERFLDYLSTNRIKGKGFGSATYTVWCHAHGGSVDDLIIYKVDDDHFFLIANASNREKDLFHLNAQKEMLGFDVKIEELFNDTGIIALQGPSAVPLMTSLISSAQALKAMHFIALDAKRECYLSRTGYTGAGGYEIFGPATAILEWWDLLLEKGKSYGILPIGLGARDTLRLEMGFALFGHELTDTIAPSESVSSWTIKWDKESFLGKEALESLENSGSKRFAYGVSLLEKGIPRQGYPLFKKEKAIGEVTSGTFSPILNKGIALILVQQPLEIGERLSLNIRQTQCPVEVVSLPFVSKHLH